MLKKLTSLLLSLSLLLAFYLWSQKDQQKSSPEALTSPREEVSFKFSNQDGRAISKDFLKGKFWIGSFILTSCQGPCPLITQQMAQLSLEFKDEKKIGLLSFSVDPKKDSPLVLYRYAKKHQFDQYKNWNFLSGNYAITKTLIRKIFLLPFTEDPNLHTTKLIIFSEDFKVYGYYDSLDKKEVLRLKKDLKKLLRPIT